VKPLLKRFSPEKNASTNSHDWEVRDASNLAMDDVTEMSSRAPDEHGGLCQIQDLRHRGILEFRGLFSRVDRCDPNGRRTFFGGKDDI
jgi:hypothetical protein